MSKVRIGLLRLVDSAPVLLAAERGLFAAQGIHADLSIEPSWANIADKLTYGLLDAAVMLPPLAIACARGLRGVKVSLAVPMGLSLGGNSIVLAGPVAAAVGADADPMALGRRLVAWMRAQAEPPRFAVVHAFSTHHLLLRAWLAGCGADLRRDLRIVSVPPEMSVQAISEGGMAGFCAGAPWGTVAEELSAGVVVLGSSAIWPLHPEKCLAVRLPWAEADSSRLSNLLRALLRSARMCDDPAESGAIASLLSGPGLGLSRTACRAALPGGAGPERITFHAHGAWMARRTHERWFVSQMRHWGWLGACEGGPPLYRPDLLEPAAAAEGLA
ncbi:MAG TPA: CmpA/NrtA family ABC transporter substrate-binding protein [Acetobacteraceae bacterium]|nr:CmpA/NrtA family ABC transporter substrate-binding protein [Acetobacteraceae bacterium]